MKTKGYSTIAGLENLTPEEIKKRNLETYGNRIKSFRTRAGMSAEQLAQALQISKSSIRNWECGLTRPDPEFIYRMFSILDVEPNEFFGFSGIGNLLTAQEKTLVDNYRALDSHSQRDLSIFANALANQAYMRKLNKAYQDMQTVVSFGRYASAGVVGEEWPEDGERKAGQVILFRSAITKRADEVIMVNGDSMEPQFHHGDNVLVQYCTELRNGDVGVFFVPGIGGVIKQKAYDRLHSINPKYDDVFPYEEGAKLVGRVLCTIDETMRPSRDQQMLFMKANNERQKNPEAFDAFGVE